LQAFCIQIKLNLNFRENWRCNKELIIQRHKGNAEHKTPSEDKQNNNITQQKTKKMSNTDPIKTCEWNQVFPKGKQFLVFFLDTRRVIYSLSSSDKVLSVIEERNHLHKREKIHSHVRNEYNGQPVHNNDRRISIAITSP
jgi:hypothetical protein